MIFCSFANFEAPMTLLREDTQPSDLSVFYRHHYSVGYSDELAGLACTIVILVGAAGTVLFGILAQVCFSGTLLNLSVLSPENW